MSRLSEYGFDRIEPAHVTTTTSNKVHGGVPKSQGLQPTLDVAAISSSSSSSAIENPEPKRCTSTYSNPELWQPFWLRTPVLVSFLCLYAGSVVATLLVYHFSQRNNGLSVSQSTSHYAWTYGPTAVLVLVASLWRQVDHRCKQLAPWSQMYNRSAKASVSVLLDYLSPLQVVSFVQAVKNRQYSVVASVSGFALLKLMTVFSTGFLILESTPVTERGHPLATTTRFDDSRFSLDSVFYDTGPNAVYTYYGNTVQGLPYNVGANNRYAYTIFEPTGRELANATVVAEVDVFDPGYNCSIVDSHVGELDTTLSSTLTIVLADGQVCQQWGSHSVSFPTSSLETTLFPKRIVLGDWSWIRCNGSADDPVRMDSLNIYTILDTRYGQNPVFNETSGTTSYPNSTWEVAKLTTVACVASPRVMKARISNDTTTSQAFDLSLIKSEPGYALPLFNGTQMVNTMITMLPLKLFDPSDSNYGDVLLKLAALSQNNTSTDYEVFLDGQALRAGAESVFNGVMSSWAHRNLVRQARGNITGEVTYQERRLHVSRISLWIMVAGFLSLMLATITVWCSAARRVVSRDPGSIGAAAAILSRTSELNELLRKTRADSERSLKQELTSHSFRTRVAEKDNGPSFQIDVLSPDISLDGRDGKVQASQGPTWRPFSLSSPVVILTFILPLIVIPVLEVIQSVSDRHEGILDVSEGSEKYSRYIPVLVMLLVATLFNSLDFNVMTMCAYSGLWHARKSGGAYMSSNLLGKTPPHVLFHAVKEGHLGPAMSTVASLIGSMLTIVVAGLYVVQDSRSSLASRHLDRMGTFNLTWNNSVSDDNHAAVILSLVENLNMSYPNFTSAEIALPEFSLGNWINTSKAESATSSSAYATIPALRGNLNCSVVQRSRINVWTDENGYFLQNNPGKAAYVNSSIDLSTECQQSIADYNPAWSTFNNSFKFPSTDPMYAGAQINLNYGRGVVNVTWPYDYFAHPDATNIADNPPNCPSLAFAFGRFEWNSTDTSNITTMYCFQEMQEVQVAVALLPDSLRLDTTQPPVVDESSVRTLQNGYSGSTAFQYRIQNNIANGLPLVDNFRLDAFFNAMLNGSDPTSPESLMGPTNEQKLVEKTNSFYRKYIALALNANMRVLCADLNEPCHNIIGSATTGTTNTKRQSSTEGDDEFAVLTISLITPRLRQDKTSKLVLQIMLACMSVCGLFAYWSTKMRRILPYNPCSIAGTMGLLAGSRLCADQGADSSSSPPVIPPGAEWTTDHDLHAIFADHRFSLGWWRTETPDDGYEPVRHEHATTTETSGHDERYGIDIGPQPTGHNGSRRQIVSRRGGNASWGLPGVKRRRGYHRALSTPEGAGGMELKAHESEHMRTP